jgi:hypothetical protein
LAGLFIGGDAGMKQPRPLRRVIIKEEYVALTGDYISAVLLSQIEYWTRRTYDFDGFLAEENGRAGNEGKELGVPFMHGWIYKSAEDFATETMMGLSANTIRTRLKKLAECGWIGERNNPEHSWDRTKQYRFNASTVAASLERFGYHLEGWTYAGEKSGKAHGCAIANFEDGNSNSENANATAADRSSNFEDRSAENFGAIPEIITEIKDQQQQRMISDHRSIVDRADGVKSGVVVDQSTQIISALEPDKETAANQPKTGAEKKEAGARPESEVADVMDYARSKGFEVADDCARDFLAAAGGARQAQRAVDWAVEAASLKVRRGEKIRNPAGLLFAGLRINSGARLDPGGLNSDREKRLAEKEKKYRDLYLS